MSDPFDTGVVTVMFTDVEGSTDLTRRLGDEAARRTIDSHKRIVREALAEYGGREIDSIGDGFMITFLSTRRAIACAVAIHKTLAAHGREHSDEDVRVRIGLNVGEVLERGGHPFGAAVNATQRVASHAKGGQIFVSEPVRHLAGTIPEVTFRDRGRFTLKGFSERWRLYEVVSAPAKEKAPPKPKAESGARRRLGLLVGAVAVGAAVLALAAFLVLRGGTETLSRVRPNSVGLIDPGSGDIVGEVPVGNAPADVTYGEQALWVANSESGTISRIDPDSRDVSTFTARGTPRSVAVGEGSVWVADGFENKLAIFDKGGTVRNTIDLPGPKDVAVGFGAAWVANATDTNVVSVDAETYEPRFLANGTAVAVGKGAVWVADGKTLRRFDPESRKPIGHAIELRFRASQIAVGTDGVAWVTHQADDAVSRVEPGTSTLAITSVGNDPTGIAVGAGSVWVASSLGSSLVQLRPDNGEVVRTIVLGSSPQGVAVAAGRVWVTTQSG